MAGGRRDSSLLRKDGQTRFFVAEEGRFKVKEIQWMPRADGTVPERETSHTPRPLMSVSVPEDDPTVEVSGATAALDTPVDMRG